MFKVTDKIEKLYDLTISPTFEGDIEICEYLSPENIELIKGIMKKNDFTGKKGETVEINFMEGKSLVTILYIGLGKKESFNEDSYRELLFKNLTGRKGDILISSKHNELSDEKILCEIVYNVNYNFKEFKSENKDEDKINLELFKEKIDKDIVEEMITLNDSTDIVRDLVNLPANILTPDELGKRVLEYSKRYEFEVEILEEDRLKEYGMNLLLAVGSSSINKPKLIVMRYMGDKDSKDIIGLVGKGLTYDTGGLCLKPGDSMYEMKTDMAGGATVIGIFLSVVRNRLKKNLVVVIPACENVVSASSYKPGDIFKSMNGKYVEIVNTDAEGRLALADALTYIVREEKVTEIIDVATLTGAIMVALGTFTTGVFSNSDELYNNLERATKEYGEKIWRMPLFEEYGEHIKSKVADIKHTGIRWGGAISATKFLEVFVEGLPWAHLDVGGTVFDSNIKWFKDGATGVGVKGLYSYIKNR